MEIVHPPEARTHEGDSRLTPYPLSAGADFSES